LKKNSLFNSEEAVLETANTVLEQNKTASTINKNDYIFLRKSYKKIYKQLKLLVKMGDIQQNKLNKLNEKLDNQNILIKKTFGRYLSDDIVECILDSPQGAALGGEKRVVTILLTDIRGFTAITERETAENIVGMLNIYLEIMTEIIFKYGGTIDEFIGDSILVIFGAPLKSKDHADRSIACAIEMQNAMNLVNKKNFALGFPEIEMGIGVNTGELIVGNIGSDKRAKYAVVGSNVNLASRIESYTVGGQIFISESTLDMCQNKIKIDSYFEAKPKGVAKSIKIYDISAIEGSIKKYLNIKKDKYIMLKKNIPINISCFDGKHGTDEVFKGNILKINTREALIKTQKIIPQFTNLNISLVKNISLKKKTTLYGKITNKLDNKNNAVNCEYNVRFTSVPENFGEIIKRYEE